MKELSKTLTRTTAVSSVLVVVAVLVAASAAWGQSATPPASTQASGQTSAQGQIAVKQATKETTLIGCLGGPNDKGGYTLTNGRYKKGVEVGSAEGIDLKPQVGHMVKLNGTWAQSGAAIGENAKGQESAERHFTANKMAQIAGTCNATGKTKSQ